MVISQDDTINPSPYGCYLLPIQQEACSTSFLNAGFQVKKTFQVSMCVSINCDTTMCWLGTDFEVHPCGPIQGMHRIFLSHGLAFSFLHWRSGFNAQLSYINQNHINPSKYTQQDFTYELSSQSLYHSCPVIKFKLFKVVKRWWHQLVLRPSEAWPDLLQWLKLTILRFLACGNVGADETEMRLSPNAKHHHWGS